MKISLENWRKSYKFLPHFMKDFHDQKDLFKAIHRKLNVEKVSQVNWIQGHIYVIDVFLWFMATHGYTLQKSKANVEFEPLTKTIEASEEESLRQLEKLFS